MLLRCLFFLLLFVCFNLSLTRGQGVEIFRKKVNVLEMKVNENIATHELIYFFLPDKTIRVEKRKVGGKVIEEYYSSRPHPITKQATYTLWYENSKQIKLIGQYKNNKREGEWVGYYKDGNIRRKDRYISGIWLNGQLFDKKGEPTAYQPEYIEAILEKDVLYELKQRIIKLKIDLQITQHIVSTVVFKIQANGSVSEVSLLYPSAYKKWDEAIVNRVKNLPLWIPAKEDGFPVDSYKSLVFSTNEEVVKY